MKCPKCNWVVCQEEFKILVTPAYQVRVIYECMECGFIGLYSIIRDFYAETEVKSESSEIQ